MNIAQLLNSIEDGSYTACKDCPWNPEHRSNTSFGVSCPEHGLNWREHETAISMLIAQDPANTTPEKTGSLCGFSNAQFSTDISAQHGLDLWKAAVSLSHSDEVALRYMKNHYWTNAIMHGVKSQDKHEYARLYCRNVLKEQIMLLSPKVIITCGKDAANSLYEIGLLHTPWDVFREEFTTHIHSEKTILPSGNMTTIFCTYHGAGRAVKTHVARLYSQETDRLLLDKIEKLPNKTPAMDFLKKYQGLNGDEKGMRVLLLHWLDFGEEIRRLYPSQ